MLRLRTDGTCGRELYDAYPTSPCYDSLVPLVPGCPAVQADHELIIAQSCSTALRMHGTASQGPASCSRVKPLLTRP